MITLKAGDWRQKGDEFRVSDLGREIPCFGQATNYFSLSKRTDYPDHFHVPIPPRPSSWSKVTTLLGHVILASDLMHLEFRRPT